ncbi:membrane-bound lytic murein transglycosylase B [Desulfocicer vacuolatum DSM 3385]|uniref:Membrane-bound lytic murein transglycosylase B n=1 Tax=Desulfocicer vacuolatum DSM 3385 TaxID=1121400 RepID=A0A1W2A4P1_9BACT|nr:lytic murein transglycosylase [Desulfocicer vacuolatum]SMC55442.1 membrane-bound lytic murein transglycosylase B [Desulfocicer vacuolatum DSM 3385]
MTHNPSPTANHGRSLFSIFALAFMLFFIIPTSAPADNIKGPKELNRLENRLLKDGFSRDYIEKTFTTPGAAFALKGVSLFFVHSESSLNYDQFISKKSIANALKYMTAHQKDLQAAQDLYGVDKTIITAIILVETRLGTYLGNRRVINTLATMAALSEKKNKEALWASLATSKRFTRKKFDKKVLKKSQWAYAELQAFLKFAQREKIDPVAVKGSYAGAMGISQFMPSNALTLGKDGNGDGKVNLFEHPDAIHSIANYLKRYGWKPTVSRQRAHKILYKYNHSNYYVDTLLKISDKLKK